MKSQSKTVRWLVPLSVLLLSACASMSESECRVGDWYGVGLRDGQSGEPSRLASYAESCAKTGVIPNLDIYNNGRQRGLRSYCTAENGFQVGRSGGYYANVCEADAQASFLFAYQRGRARYDLEQKIDFQERRLEDAAKQQQKLIELIAKATQEDDRRQLLRKLDSSLSEQNRLRYELARLSEQRAHWRD